MELTAGHVWIMVSAALVLLMTPGLAFFYGGMTRAKAALNMMMMSFISIGMVGVIWVLWGYSMTSGDGFLQMVGNPFANFGLEGIDTPDGLITVGFGATFAIITVALISGAIADRAKFGATIVGTGTKIDNLVQIGHNVRIGRSCIICGCAALAGSVVVHDGATIAGGVGIADNITIGAGAKVGARSGVMDDIPAGESWVGYPARPAKQTFRILAALNQLPDVMAQVKKLMRAGE